MDAPLPENTATAKSAIASRSEDGTSITTVKVETFTEYGVDGNRLAKKVTEVTTTTVDTII
jgi:hypothetical protein